MATIADVARRAGVSMSTVSYALSGVRPVSEATRRRIEAAMKELDYTPNAVAQGLAGRRTRILALVLPTDEMPVDPFTGEIIVGAAEAAREQGYHLLLWTEPASLATELPGLLGKQLIDGAIVLSIRIDDDRIDALQAAGLPMTMIGRTRDPSGLPFVDTDADLVAELALAHLAALGHRAVAYVGTAQADPSVGLRLHRPLAGEPAAGGRRPRRAPGHHLCADEELTMVDLGPDVLAFRRGSGLLCAVNMGSAVVDLPAGSIVLASDPGLGPTPTGLPADTAVWLLPTG